MNLIDRIVIKFYLMKIYVKLFLSYLNPMSELFLNPITFFLLKKARRASQDPMEKVDVETIHEEVSSMVQ